MPRPVRVLLSESTNPWFNLATEDWIFRELDPATRTLFLWRNDDTVVIGRHQNPWVECKVEQMREDGVVLARRQSGGGAVFHDLGNTNFTFLSGSDRYRLDENFEIVVNALTAVGVEAERSGRNDILVQGRKVSGSAFKHTRERSFHHGTLLVDADLGRLQNYLNPHPKKLEAKGIKSVRSRVANLTEFVQELNHDRMCDAVVQSFLDYHGATADPELLDKTDLEAVPSLREYYDTMADWEWRFGRTPQFSHRLQERFEWGLIDLHLDVERGVIRETRLFSDALDVTLIEDLQGALAGVRYDTAHLAEALVGLAAVHQDRAAEIAEFRNWIVSSIG